MRRSPLVLLFLTACSSGTTAAPVDPVTVVWTEACVRVSGCEPYVSTSDPFFACSVSKLEFNGTAPADCAIVAPDCRAAVSCFGAGTAPSLCAGSRTARCDGDVRRGCDAGLQLEVARDCATEGLSCRLNDFDDAHCAQEGSCTQDRCEGNVLVNCFGSIPVPRDCGIGVCTETESGATCAGEGEVCDGPVFRCDGDVAVSCRGGRIHREQCRPGACVTDDGARCLSTEECAPRCEGTEVVRCVSGIVERYDCAAWGFTECVSDSGEASCR